MTTKQQILNQLEQHKAEIRALGAARIGLFGSYSRNEQNETSDIDLLVDFQEGCKNYRNLCNLYYYLDGLFHTKIELVTLPALAPFVWQQVQKEIEYVTIAD